MLATFAIYYGAVGTVAIFGIRSKRGQVGSATNKTATRRNGDNLINNNSVILATDSQNGKKQQVKTVITIEDGAVRCGAVRCGAVPGYGYAYASYLSCIIVQIQLTLLVRFITTYSDNATSLTLFNQTKCNHACHKS